MALEKQNHGHKTPIPHKKRGGGSQAEVSEEACFGRYSKELCSLKTTGLMKRTALKRGSSRIHTGYLQAGFDARRGLEMGTFDSYPALICRSLIRLHWNFTFGLSTLWISCSNRLEGGVAYKP
jgi:hypothetical protein